MNLTKWKRLGFSIALLFATVIILTRLFQVPAVASIFSAKNISGATGYALWILIWVVIFLECAVIPGSYLPFLVFFSQTSLAADPYFFVAFVTSAVFAGRIVAYFVGQKFAGAWLQWALGDTYLEWSQTLSGPQGKAVYAFTVAAPGFPDFILALVAGAIRMNFTFYIIVNLVCKAIENYLLVFSHKFQQAVRYGPIFIVQSLHWVSLLGLFYLLLSLCRKRNTALQINQNKLVVLLNNNNKQIYFNMI